MKEIEKLKSLLAEASALCVDNMDKAENIDLHDMYETIDNLIYQLDEIEDFEAYSDEDEE
jgi:hypothetical protein